MGERALFHVGIIGVLRVVSGVGVGNQAPGAAWTGLA